MSDVAPLSTPPEGPMDDVQIHGRLFAQCVGFLTQKGTWLFEVDRAFASEEWSEPVQMRFVLTPGAYPMLEVRRV